MKQAIHSADTATEMAAPRIRFGKISEISYAHQKDLAHLGQQQVAEPHLAHIFAGDGILDVQHLGVGIDRPADLRKYPSRRLRLTTRSCPLRLG
jgi:hypothetical protein